MNPSAQNPSSPHSSSGGFPACGANPSPGEFEATLRLIAQLPAPGGLAERIEAGLRTRPATTSQTASGRARILAWPASLRLESGWMRSAAAAAIVFVVVGGGWGVCSRAGSNQKQRRLALPQLAAPGGFQGAGAMRTPQTLNGPRVEEPAVAHPATGVSQLAKTAPQPAAQKKPVPLHGGNPAFAGPTVAYPAAPPAK